MNGHENGTINERKKTNVTERPANCHWICIPLGTVLCARLTLISRFEANLNAMYAAMVFRYAQKSYGLAFTF